MKVELWGTGYEADDPDELLATFTEDSSIRENKMLEIVVPNDDGSSGIAFPEGVGPEFRAAKEDWLRRLPKALSNSSRVWAVVVEP